MIADGAPGDRVHDFDIYIAAFHEQGDEAPEEALHRLFGLDVVHALEFVESLPRVVKRRVPGHERERYERALQALGAVYELRASPIEPRPTIAVEGAACGKPERAYRPTGRTLTLPPPLVGPPGEPPRGAAPSAGVPTWCEGAPPPTDAGPSATTHEPSLPPPSPPEAAAGETPEAAAGETPEAAAGETKGVGAAPPAWGSLDPGPPVPGWRPVAAAAPVAGEVSSPRDAVARPVWEVPELGSPQLPGVDWVSDHTSQMQPGLELQSARAAAAKSVPDPAQVTVARAAQVPGQPWARWEPATVRPVMVPQPATLPLGLRLALRAGLGLAGFVLIVLIRQSGAFGADVDDVLAQWGEREGDVVLPGSKRYGPVALDWMQSELHQFSHPDKDRIRGLVVRYLSAGAVEVYVGDIRRDATLQRAGQLIVELPPRGPNRAGVFAMHSDFFAAGSGRLGSPESLDDTGQQALVIRL